VNAERVIAELRSLDARSGGRRVAWTETWSEERERLCRSLEAELPQLRVQRDEAANIWMLLAGERSGTVVAGSHLDCVPDGGWLDGCLGVMAAVEAARQLAAEPASARATLAVVDWADEEGARSGHSLLGSSAATGLLDVDHVLSLRTADGGSLAELLRANGVEPERMPDSRARLADAHAYVELHIEQGPVLETQDRACAAVSGCLGVRRSLLRLTGEAAHAGATPMALRHDPTLALAQLLIAVHELALAEGGLATVGTLRALPGTPTAVPEAVELVLDIRHHDLDTLDRMAVVAVRLADHAARDAGCTAAHELIWSIDPIPFDERLVARAARLAGGAVLLSGALHDAAAVARAGVPTAMLFVRTRGGISHSRAEDAGEQDLALGIDAFGALVSELVLEG
jgi:hydantoinase/carbamoylase family amidase